MIFVRRLLTALVLFALFFVVFRTLALGIGGGVAGAKATSALQAQGGRGPQNFNEGFAVGVKAGAEFRQRYGQTIGLVSLAVAAVGALWLSFGGVLPWCRAVSPPPLPGGQRFG